MFISSKDIAEKIVKEYGAPVFVADAETIRKNARELLDAFAAFDMNIFYAMKANYNPHIVRIIKESGIYGIDAVSPNEVQLALELGYLPEQIIFTPSNPSDEEMRYVGSKGVLQNLGSLSELERFGKLFPKQDVSIRISPEVGAGESAKVATGGSASKFGILMEDMHDVRKIAKKYGLRVIGIHSHIGSGFYATTQFKKSVEAVCAIAKNFKDVIFLDFGGGFGVQYHPDKSGIDLPAFAESIKKPIERFEKETGKKVTLRIEPGKYVVTQSTVLLARVTTIKKKKDTTFVGVDAGFYNLIRPAMYGAYHHVVNLSNPKGTKERVQVVGNVCETCDVFNGAIDLAKPREGDVLGILCAGGYGTSMSSNYNMREHAPEVLIDGEKIRCTRRRQTFDDIMSTYEAYI